MDTNETWLNLLRHLLTHGQRAHPDNPGGATYEVLAFQTRVSMFMPVVTVPARKLGIRFLAAESAWILSGDNRLSSIAPFARQIGDTCDDGLTFRGAYGPKFADQVGWVADELSRDPASRRAVMTLWRERPGATRDTPCTLSLQWFVRPDEAKGGVWRLHCSVAMRSSDAMLGIVYDWHAFSMMSLHLLLTIRARAPLIPAMRPWRELEGLRLGHLTVTAGSQHLYERDADAARECLTAKPPFPAYAPLVADEFSHPDQLTDHLWHIARREPTDRRWLTDLVPGKVAPTE